MGPDTPISFDFGPSDMGSLSLYYTTKVVRVHFNATGVPSEKRRRLAIGGAQCVDEGVLYSCDAGTALSRSGSDWRPHLTCVVIASATRCTS
jgi:hypothetical protein